MLNNLEYEITIDYDNLYTLGTNLSKKVIELKQIINEIDKSINLINDSKIWKDKILDTLLEKYNSDKINLEKIYIELLSYITQILKTASLSEDFVKQATAKINEIEEIKLWSISI